MTTIVQQLLAAQGEIESWKSTCGPTDGPAAREYALANTAIEDAIMRTNRAFAMRAATFKVADVQAEQYS